jgi:TIR domain
LGGPRGRRPKKRFQDYRSRHSIRGGGQLISNDRDTLRVFISYARRDASAFAEELLCGLEVAGFEAFLDRHDIAAGEDWEARLGGLIASADTVVYVITPAAVASERCKWEVDRAAALSKRVIPIVALDVAEAETPEALKRLNYIFFTQGHSFAKSLGELAKALRVDLDWIREHTRLSEVARRWQERERSEVLLLRGAELEAAKAWLTQWRTPAPEPTDLHRAFIAASEAAEGAVIKRERARARRVLVAVSAAAVVFAGLAGVSWVFWQRAEIATERAKTAEREAQETAAGALFYEGIYWLRVAFESDRQFRTESLSKAEGAFARGLRAIGSEDAEIGEGSVSLEGVLRYGRRYAIHCSGRRAAGPGDAESEGPRQYFSRALGLATCWRVRD